LIDLPEQHGALRGLTTCVTVDPTPFTAKQENKATRNAQMQLVSG
jgi:hypothetical protein